MKQLRSIFLTLLTFSAFFITCLIEVNSSYANSFNKTTYLCRNNDTVKALFVKGDLEVPHTYQGFVESDRVSLTLNNGRHLILSKSLSEDEIKYQNDDDTISFVIRGNGSFIKENGKKTYFGCIRLTKKTKLLSHSYVTKYLSNGFTMRYPDGYSLNKHYENDGSKPGKQGVRGIKVSVRPPLIEGTNLRPDSGVSVEQIPGSNQCNAGMFFNGESSERELRSRQRDNDILYSVIERKDKRMNSTHEEKVWAIPNSYPCTAIRYFIYYRNYDMIGPENRIREFNRKLILRVFDKIRHSVVINQWKVDS